MYVCPYKLAFVEAIPMTQVEQIDYWLSELNNCILPVQLY